MNMQFAAAIAVCAGSFGLAQATDLIFDIDGISNGNVLDDGYGDRVTALVDGDFRYGAAGGFTPNIVVDYRGVGGNELSWWDQGYNALQGVIYNEPEGANGFEVEFTADSGWLVSLDSFDLGNFGGPETIGISVVDGVGNVLFEDAAFGLEAASGSSGNIALTGVQAQSLTLRIDTTGLGGSSDNIGLDNIVFSQVVPSPGAGGLLLAAGVLVGRRRR